MAEMESKEYECGLAHWRQQRPGPAKAAQVLVNAIDKGNNVRKMLQLEQQFVWCKARKGSIKSVCSALRCWHTFAQTFLRYGDRTLPPRDENDVCLWVTGCFKSPETAHNYCSYIKWTCTKMGLGVDWYGDRLKSHIKAAKSVSLQTHHQTMMQQILP